MSLPGSDSPFFFLVAEMRPGSDDPARPDFTIESRAIRAGGVPVAGIDEVGRGPLAGPVVAAAVILDPERIPEGLDDSKRLKREERERIFGAIMATAQAVSVASVSASVIDASDIRKASLEAMRRAVRGLCTTPRLCLVDGRDVPPSLGCESIALIRGDQRSQSIAAASIIAKVARDRMMARCGMVHSSHGFGDHAGYGTERHRTAILTVGPVARIHRLSFGLLKAG